MASISSGAGVVQDVPVRVCGAAAERDDDGENAWKTHGLTAE
jgi:hypothetical protein